jgi:hypothetical protein
VRPDRTALALRVFKVAENLTYKFKVIAGGVNVASPSSYGVEHPAVSTSQEEQDYFVAPTQEWVFGTRCGRNPEIVRQFQVHEGNSG